MPKVEEEQEVSLNVIEVEQPIGSFYLAKVPHKVLVDITYFDVRRMLKERDVERYLGIQRPLSPKRVEEIRQFVGTADACFPTNVILSVRGRSAAMRNGKLVLRNDPAPEKGRDVVYFKDIAKVLDGQHRIAGLEGYKGEPFDVPVCIFVDIDMADEAFIFSTVNLAQTKVNRSLVYDLFDLAKARSPQKSAHTVVVTLDRTKGSPLFQRIKRLGSATPGREGTETLTQATLVESMLPHLSGNPIVDRDLYLRGRRPAAPTEEEVQRHVLRPLFLAGKEKEITDIFWNYFSAVADRWPQAWSSVASGDVLNRTNGVRALMRFFAPVYRTVGGPGSVPAKDKFTRIFEKIKIKDDEFNSERYKPGTSGESLMYAEFLSQGLEGRAQ